MNFAIQPTAEGGPTVDRPGCRVDLRRRIPPVRPLPDLHRADPVPRREHELQRLSPACRASWRKTATCPASSASAATASPSPGASSCPRRRRRGCSSSLRRRHPRCSSRSTRSASSCASPCRRSAWSATGQTEQASGWAWRAAINGFGGVLTFVVLVVVASVKFVDGAYLVVILIPTLVGVMLFIQRQYRRVARELAVRPDFVIGPPQREERVDRAGPGHQPRRHPGPERRPLDRRRHPGGLHLRRSRRRRAQSARNGSARCRESPWSSSSRRTGPWLGRSSPISTSWTTPGRRIGRRR